MSRWTAASRWTGARVQREVFFFPSNSVDLYGSLYAAQRTPARTGYVICPPWGYEAAAMHDAMHAFALGMSRLGGAALVFQWPGHGDSRGDAARVTFDDLVRATLDATEAAKRRCGQVDWALAGFRIGAAAAVLATELLPVSSLLLVQPVLDPDAFVEAAERQLERAARVGSGSELGQPPQESEVSLRGVDSTKVSSVLKSFPGGVGVARCASPGLEAGIESTNDVIVRTDWRRELRQNGRRLVPAALRCARLLEAT